MPRSTLTAMRPWLTMALSLASMASRSVYRPAEQPPELSEAIQALVQAELVVLREPTTPMLTARAAQVCARLRAQAIDAVPIPAELRTASDEDCDRGEVAATYNRAVAEAEGTWPRLLIDSFQDVLRAVIETDGEPGAVRGERPIAEPTPRQLDVLKLVVRHARQGVQLSYREMSEALGVASTNTVAEHIHELRKKGLVRRPTDGRKARSVIPTQAGRLAVERAARSAA